MLAKLCAVPEGGVGGPLLQAAGAAAAAPPPGQAPPRPAAGWAAVPLVEASGGARCLRCRRWSPTRITSPEVELGAQGSAAPLPAPPKAEPVSQRRTATPAEALLFCFPQDLCHLPAGNQKRPLASKAKKDSRSRCARAGNASP
mmetsp:Transcript_114173/g.317835  ORF Transcript_114173/g.317835 Transcript_114173/m.317835 type:complete len:144 (+) Transcript_114173:443-874(+)